LSVWSLRVNKLTVRGVTPSPPQSLSYERRLDEPSRAASNRKSIRRPLQWWRLFSLVFYSAGGGRIVVLYTLYSCHYCCCCCLVVCGGQGEDGLRARVRTLTTRVCCVVVLNRFPTHMAIDTGISYCKAGNRLLSRHVQLKILENYYYYLSDFMLCLFTMLNYG